MQLKKSPFLIKYKWFSLKVVYITITFIEVTSLMIKSLLCLYFIIICTKCITSIYINYFNVMVYIRNYLIYLFADKKRLCKKL